MKHSEGLVGFLFGVFDIKLVRDASQFVSVLVYRNVLSGIGIAVCLLVGMERRGELVSSIHLVLLNNINVPWRKGRNVEDLSGRVMSRNTGTRAIGNEIAYISYTTIPVTILLLKIRSIIRKLSKQQLQ